MVEALSELLSLLALASVYDVSDLVWTVATWWVLFLNLLPPEEEEEREERTVMLESSDIWFNGDAGFILIP